MKKLMTMVLAGAMLLAMSARTARADDDEETPKPKPAPKAAAGALTDESLGALLEKLGYEAKAEKTKTGTVYFLEFEQDGWTFRFTVSLSPNKKFLWVSTSVCTLPEGKKPSADALLKLLEATDRMGPTMVGYDAKYRQVRVSVALWNRGITASLLKEQLGFFTNNVKEVAKLCEGLKGPAPKAKKPTPPVLDDDDK